MFHYTQEDVDNKKINVYNLEESEKMLQFLDNDDFEQATLSLENGADPNFCKWNNHNDEIGHTFLYVLYSLWNNQSVYNLICIDDVNTTPPFMLPENDSLYVEDDENKKIFLTFKKFFQTWAEKGGDINKTVFCQKENDYRDNENMAFTPSDSLYKYILISTEKKSNSSQHPTTQYFHYTSDIVNLLDIINTQFIPLKISPVYQQKSVLGILTSEGWSYDQNNFINLIDEKHPNFFIDDKGDTPLHYPLNHMTQKNYYISQKNISFSEYINNYSTFVKNNFSQDTLIIKNKEELLPIEKMIKEKSYLQAIALGNIMLEHNIDLKNIDFSALTIDNIKTHYSRFYNEDDKNFKTIISPLQTYIEKIIINNSLSSDNQDSSLTIQKKRI